MFQYYFIAAWPQGVINQHTMALINCPECGRQVSDAAKSCPQCGYPIGEGRPAPARQVPVQEDELLAQVRPSWWGYFWWLLFFWLIIPWIVAWVKRSALTLRVYRTRVTLEVGIFSKSYTEIFMKDVRSIDIDQTLIQRMAGIGDISISSSASADATLDMYSVPDPGKVRDLIIAQRQQYQA
jgi:membrane protein YdbS with pleckstrin-like domain